MHKREHNIERIIDLYTLRCVLMFASMENYGCQTCVVLYLFFKRFHISFIWIIFIFVSAHINKKIDIISLGETYLNSSYRLDDPDLHINGYNLIRADHPSDTKRGGVAIYYKNYLPLQICDVSFLDECILLQMKFDEKECFFIIIISFTKSIFRWIWWFLFEIW